MEKTPEVDENTFCEQASELLAGIIQRMGYEGLKVQSQMEDERILLDIVGDEERELVGKKGQTLDALQYLLARAINSKGIKCPIVVDDGGYRERRKEALTELAKVLLEEATSTGKTIALNPLGAHDRRVIHVALKEEPGVTTHSEGDGIHKRVLVKPVQE